VKYRDKHEYVHYLFIMKFVQWHISDNELSRPYGSFLELSSSPPDELQDTAQFHYTDPYLVETGLSASSH